MNTFPPIEEQMALLRRGSVDLVDEDQLRAKLVRAEETGKPLVVKTGFDPTSPDLHLGHTVLLRKMRHFQELGHRVIFLIGDFTAMIGDPSGKKATRPQLSAEQIEANSETYKRQAFHLLDPETTEVLYNGSWMKELGAEGMIRLAGRYTLARMLERDDFRTRLENNQPIGIHELLYPLTQGYDSVALEADVELGGHDQIFNLLVGRQLMKEHGLEPQVVLTIPLLVGTDGVDKMSKSLGNAIAVEDPPKEIYGKTMSIADELMWDWYAHLSELPEAEIEAKQRAVAAGDLHPKRVKMDLARHLVTEFHDSSKARAAEEEFETVFHSGGQPDEIDIHQAEDGSELVDLLVEAGLTASKNEARRLVQQGAVSLDGDRIEDPFFQPPKQDEPHLVKVGKRRFLKVRIQ